MITFSGGMSSERADEGQTHTHTRTNINTHTHTYTETHKRELHKGGRMLEETHGIIISERR